MRRAGKRALLAAAALAATALLSSCLTLAESMNLLASRAFEQGLLSDYQAEMLKRAAAAAAQATEGLSPEDEYFVGRAVAASIFRSFPPYDAPELNAYLNKLGQGLALYSLRPAIYTGYRFFALDSPEVNAFATPGGHILITRGLLSLVQDEDELAAVLAHEIAHVALGHGLSSVQGARFAKIASQYALDAGSSEGGTAADFTAAFGDAIADLAKVLVVSGYSQTFELQADWEAYLILKAAGRDPEALARLISRLPVKEESSGSGVAGYATTHPSPSTRLDALAREKAQAKGQLLFGRVLPFAHSDGFGELPESDKVAAREARFEAMRCLF